MTIASKLCPRCKEWKPLTMFGKNYCRPCRAERIREYRAATLGIITPKDVFRFWSRVNKNGPEFQNLGPCWIWTGKPHNTGYGQIQFAGRNTHTHLVSLLLAGRQAPEDRPFADHMCRRRICCNPAHLRYVSPYINGVENNDSPHAINARKTHCKRGHAFDEANTMRGERDGRPIRQCRACTTLRPSYLKKLRQESHEQI